MKMNTVCLSLGLVISCLMVEVSFADELQAGKQVQRSTTVTVDGDKVTIRHWTYLPAAYNMKRSRPAPMLLFLHGAGESGSDLKQVLKWGPPKRLAAGKHYPLVIVSPQCPDRKIGWNAKQLVLLMEELAGEYNVDRTRIYCSGLSMGGTGTFALMQTAPELLAAAVPICGRGDLASVKNMIHQPVRIYVGSEDGVLEANRQMTTAIEKAGGDVALTVYQGVGHVCWPAVYEDADFYKWLLKQQRDP